MLKWTSNTAAVSLYIGMRAVARWHVLLWQHIHSQGPASAFTLSHTLHIPLTVLYIFPRLLWNCVIVVIVNMFLHSILYNFHQHCADCWAQCITDIVHTFDNIGTSAVALALYMFKSVPLVCTPCYISYRHFVLVPTAWFRLQASVCTHLYVSSTHCCCLSYQIYLIFKTMYWNKLLIVKVRMLKAVQEY